MFMPIILLALTALLFAPVIPIIRRQTTGKVARYSVFCNLASFASLCIILTCYAFSGTALAETATEAASSGLTVGAGLGLLGAGIVMGLATIGAGISVASAAAAAIGATGEDPKMFVKSLIFVALGEGIPVYGLLVVFQILAKI